jgi:hypothetical protein
MAAPIAFAVQLFNFPCWYTGGQDGRKSTDAGNRLPRRRAWIQSR